MATNVQTTLTLLATLRDDASAKLKTLGGNVEGVDASQKKAAQSVINLSDRYAIQQRQMEQLNAKYATLDQSTAKGAQQAAQLEIRQASLGLAMTKTVQAAETEAQAMSQAAQAEQALASVTNTTTNNINKTATSITNLTSSITTHNSSVTNLTQTINTQESAWAGMTKTLATAAAGYASFKVLADSFSLVANLDQNRRALGTLLGDVEKGNDVYKRAIDWGKQYGFTQSEMASSAASAAGIIKKSNQPVEQILDTLGRLASLNPAEGIEGATFALKELASGDINSIVERFNLSRDAANEMKDAIKDGADPVKVLSDALAEMGISSEVLANRMEGPAGALNRLKQSAEDSKIAIGNFLAAIGVPQLLNAFAAGLGTIADGFNKIATGVPVIPSVESAMAGLTANALQSGKSFEEYKRILDAAGMGQEAFSQQAYTVAQALTQQGLTAQQAATAVAGLSDQESVLRTGLNAIAGEAGLADAGINNIVERTLALAASSPEAQTAVQGLIDAFDGGRGGLEEFTAGLSEAEQREADNASETNRLEGAHIAMQDALAGSAVGADTLTSAASGLIDSLFGANDAAGLVSGALYDNEYAQIASANAAEQNTAFHDDLMGALEDVANGSVSTAGASARLAQQYGLEIGQVRTLIDNYNRLNEARAGRMGVSLGRDIAGSLPSLVTHAELVRDMPEAFGPKAKKARKSGGGRKAGKSDEEKQAEKDAKAAEKADKKREADTAKHLAKLHDIEENYAEKLDDLNRDHAEKRAKIWDDYYAKQKAATDKFNSDKFDQELSFRDNLKGLDQASRDADIAAERAYWAESQAMAQAGHAQQAADLYNAGVEITEARRQRAEDIKKLEQEITETEDAEQKARLEQELAYERDLDARYRQREDDKLKTIREGGDALAEERDEKLQDEETRYAEANAKLKDDFAEAVGDVIDSADELAGAIQKDADVMIEAFNSMAEASAAMAARAGSPDAPGAAENLPGRAGGGTVNRGTTYRVGEHGPEVFTPDRDGRILNARQVAVAAHETQRQVIDQAGLGRIADLDGRRTFGDMMGRMPATAARSTHNTNTSNNVNVAIDMRGASGPVAAAEGRLRQVVRQEIRANIPSISQAVNTDLGRSAQQKRKGSY